MFTILVGGSARYIGNNKYKAARVLNTELALIYPKCDRTRAVSTFQNGNPITVGCISGLVV